MQFAECAQLTVPPLTFLASKCLLGSSAPTPQAGDRTPGTTDDPQSCLLKLMFVNVSEAGTVSLQARIADARFRHVSLILGRRDSRKLHSPEGIAFYTVVTLIVRDRP